MTTGRGATGWVQLDLGCGTAKCPGFVGADRFPLTGVDVIVDLDSPLPFRSDSVDIVVMSHSLEHVQGLLATLKEVYRICRHGAQVCVVAPYCHQALNVANPFHKHSFNEHTPRFWTDSPHTLVEPSEFSHPHAQGGWGLSRSDHDNPGIDFRCISMEFFYFPEYRNLPPDQQRAARKKHLDVCDQIMYQLVVVKKDMAEPEMQELVKGTQFYEPPRVTLRKRDERIVTLEAEVAFERGQAATARDERVTALERLAEANADLADARERLATAHQEAAATQGQLEQVSVELAGVRSQLDHGQEAWVATARCLEVRDRELAQANQLLAQARQEAAATQGQLEQARAELAGVRSQLAHGQEAWVATARSLEVRDQELAQARQLLALTHEEAASTQSRLEQVSAELAGVRSQLAHGQEAWAATARSLEVRDQELAQADQLLAQARQEAAAARERLERVSEELVEARSYLARAREETHASGARAGDVQTRLSETSQRLAEADQRLALWKHCARAVRAELAATRSRRLVRIFSQFRPGPDFLPQVNPAFQALLDDSYLFLGDLKGYRLQPSEDLQSPRFFAYSLNLDRPNLLGLMLAPIVDLPDEAGSLGIELVTADGLILANARVALSEMDQNRPVRFMFPPVLGSARSVVLRVNARDTVAPVRLFEWRKRRLFGLRGLATRPFCAFIFG